MEIADPRSNITYNCMGQMQKNHQKPLRVWKMWVLVFSLESEELVSILFSSCKKQLLNSSYRHMRKWICLICVLFLSSVRHSRQYDMIKELFVI